MKEAHLPQDEALRLERLHSPGVLAAVAVSGLDLISYIGPDYVYRFVNHRYLTYWNKKEEEIVGQKVVELLGQALFESMVKPLLDKALEGQSVEFEAVVDFAGVGRRHVEVAYIPARDSDGAMGVVVRAHDIDAIKQRKAQLRETVALLERKTLEQERFIHIISHDLREPINTINNFSSLLAEDENVVWPEHARRYLRFIQEGGQRMVSLLDDLLHLVRLDRHAIELRPVDLGEIATQVQCDLSSQFERSGGRLEIDQLPMVTGDATLLRIVVQNLVSNALKFTDKKTLPVVRLSANSDAVFGYIHCSDNGIGIPPDKLDSIFDMFTRLHSRKEIEGTGLGLSICRRIAELHGGSVSVTSAPGEGSCFTLALPLKISEAT
jgi:PAS domain S-box-containing protein